MFAYEVTEEDVANVIRRQWVRLVNSNGVTCWVSSSC